MLCAISAGRTLRERELLRLLSLAILVGLSLLGEGELNAQVQACTTVDYLQQVPTTAGPRSNSRQPIYAIPPDTSLPGGLGSITWAGAGTYPFSLPGYGSVFATVNPYPGNVPGSNPPLPNYVPELTWGYSQPLELQHTMGNSTCLPSSTIYWGTDTNFLSLYNVGNKTSRRPELRVTPSPSISTRS